MSVCAYACVRGSNPALITRSGSRVGCRHCCTTTIQYTTITVGYNIWSLFCSICLTDQYMTLSPEKLRYLAIMILLKIFPNSSKWICNNYWTIMVMYNNVVRYKSWFKPSHLRHCTIKR